MPLMESADGRQRRVIPARARSMYEQRGWRLAGDPEPAVQATSEPASYASKGEWVDYAESLGLATEGLTKSELVEAVEGLG